MKKLLLTLALLLAPSAAFAQCTGIFPANTACGTTTSGVPHPVPFSGFGITSLTGDVTGTGPGATATTLATVNANVGTFGSATQCVTVTNNAKGLTTAISAATCTPAVGSITGLGTGVAAALGIAVNGSGGIPSPTPVAAGDLIYWNGSAWTRLPGNGTGTQVLTESSLGVPSWTTASTLTSVTIAAGQGISVTGTCTITTTGTCTVATSLSTLTASLGADVGMTNTTLFFDGPSVAQGATGTWFASGNVVVLDGTSPNFIACKLWDGTTVISSGVTVASAGATTYMSMSLSGYIANPAGNIRISCKDTTSTAGLIKFNQSGAGKDSTISVVRIN